MFESYIVICTFICINIILKLILIKIGLFNYCYHYYYYFKNVEKEKKNNSDRIFGIMNLTLYGLSWDCVNKINIF